MVDARLKGEWVTSAKHDALSDAAYRVLHNALMHSAEHGTDGAISAREIRFLYPNIVETSVLEELERSGFWESTAEGYQLIGWATDLGQSTAADIAEYRNRNRERQQAHRERQKAAREAARATHAPENARGGIDTSDRGADDAGGGGHSATNGIRNALRNGDVTKARHGTAKAVPSQGERSRARGRDCAIDGHKLVADGTCALCEYRPDREAAA